MNEIAIEKQHGRIESLWTFIAMVTLIFVSHATNLAIGIGASILISGAYLWLCHQYFKTKKQENKTDAHHFFGHL
jgi:hypothetical protein